jgi:hypothetical protein
MKVVPPVFVTNAWGILCVCLCGVPSQVQCAVLFARQEIAMEITVLIQTEHGRWDVLKVTL